MFFFTCPEFFSLLFSLLFYLLLPFFPFPTICFLFILSKYSFPSIFKGPCTSLFLDVNFPLDFSVDLFLDSNGLLGDLFFVLFIFFITESPTYDLILLILETPLDPGSFSFLLLLEFFLDLLPFFSSFLFDGICFLSFIYLERFLLVRVDFCRLRSSNKFQSEILMDFSY